MHALFLDDKSVRAPYPVIKALLEVAGPILIEYGLTLNINKSTVYESPLAVAMIDCDSPVDAHSRYNTNVRVIRDSHNRCGYTLLGSPVGSDHYITEQLRSKLDYLRRVSECLVILGNHHGQTKMAMSLLRSCFANKMRHLARTVRPDLMLPFAREFDKLLQDTVLGIVHEKDETLSTAHFSARELRDTDAYARHVIHSPIVRGGIAIPSTEAATHAAFSASALTVLPLLYKMQSAGMAIPLPTLSADHATITDEHPLALIRDHWPNWRAINGARTHVPGNDPERTVPAPGGPRQVPAVDEDDIPSSIASEPFASILVKAIKGDIPRHLQHILTVLQETRRDDAFEHDLIRECNLPSLRAALDQATHAWSEHGPITPMLRLTLMHSMSGPGHLWVLDNGNRRCSSGLPMPQSIMHTLQDAPLSDEYMCTALRMRMHLPLGRFHSLLRRQSVSKGNVIACHCSKICTDANKRFDPFGLHIATIAQANWSLYTDRHHHLAELVLSYTKAAGFGAVREKNVFHGTREADEEETPLHYDRMRMDIVAEVPRSFLSKVGGSPPSED
jgi:hypothetical protein